MTLLATTILTVVLVCSSASPGWSQTAAAEVESPYPYIHSLKISGNKAIKSKVLYNEMITPRPRIFKWKSPPRFKAGRFGQ